MSELRALVVDDSLSIRRALVEALTGIDGLSCSEARDGAEGLKRFSHERYDVVLTDINMPLMDGLKLVHHIRRSKSEVPIVVITTQSAQEDRQRALALGASAYLVKPVEADEVVSTVKELLKLP